MAQPDVNCAHLVEVVTEWMEGALPDTERVQVEEHLAICPNCTDYIAQLRHSIEVLRESPRQVPPAEARDALVEAFRRARN
ncbi:MAG TPA: zf-HC2 domain-containing protein [Ilumatobacteraceae bacterium]|nr:zf-HC2 domain-containing protein [Ilumatobacteraceae bacterium]